METGEFLSNYIHDLKETIDKIETAVFDRIITEMLNAYNAGQNIFIMGNGGSGSTASHFVCDINKGCCLDLEKKFKVICLNDNIPLMLAFSNDLSYEQIFVEQLKNFFQPGDLVIGISGSGNSENVLRAIKYANDNQGITIGLTGFSGGKLAELADIPFIVRINDMQKIEDVHMIMVHMIMQSLDRNLHER